MAATAIAYSLLLLIIMINPQVIARPRIKKETTTLIAINIFVLLGAAWQDFYANNLIKLLGLQIYSLLVIACFKSDLIKQGAISFAARAVILTHSFIFILQLSYFLLSGEYLDINSIIRDSEAISLYESKALEGLLIPIRATGIYTEPSFYAMSVLTAATVLVLQEKRISTVVLLAVATSLLSFSVAAILVSSILFVVFLFYVTGQKLIKIGALLVALTITPYLYNYFDVRINESADYDAVGSRTLIFKEIQDRPDIQNIFGHGILWDDRYPVGKYSLSGANIRDSSFYVYALYSVGLLGGLLFLAAILTAFKGSAFSLTCIFVMLLFKFHILQGSFWMLMTFIYLSTPRNSSFNRPLSRRLWTAHQTTN